MNQANRRKRLGAGNQRVDDPGKLQKTLEISPLRVPNEARYQTALRPDLLVFSALCGAFTPLFFPLSGDFIRGMVCM